MIQVRESGYLPEPSRLLEADTSETNQLMEAELLSTWSLKTKEIEARLGL